MWWYVKFHSKNTFKTQWAEHDIWKKHLKFVNYNEKQQLKIRPQWRELVAWTTQIKKRTNVLFLFVFFLHVLAIRLQPSRWIGKTKHHQVLPQIWTHFQWKWKWSWKLSVNWNPLSVLSITSLGYNCFGEEALTTIICFSHAPFPQLLKLI